MYLYSVSVWTLSKSTATNSPSPSLLYNTKTGQQFTGQIIPSATVLVVGVGRTEAKVEGLFSEICQLDYRGNVFDSMGGEILKGTWVLQCDRVKGKGRK